MKPFIQENFLLNSKSAERLYHDYVEGLPIIDYHCHLSPNAIAMNQNFADLTDAWLAGDHYKWRAMRANAVSEKFITGTADNRSKFEKWAETVPYTLRNPLYHWSHLELKRYFDISELLSEESAHSIYDRANEQLQRPQLSTHRILEKFKVETVCTTDSPLSDLKDHRALAEANRTFRMLPSFRPDQFFAIDQTDGWNDDIDRLAALVDAEIKTYDTFLEALDRRIAYFHKHGCRLSDHGFEQIFKGNYEHEVARKAFETARDGQQIDDKMQGEFQTHLLLYLCLAYARLDWTQQFHLGALRNTNPARLRELGPDTGFDSIGDFPQARNLMALLSRLEEQGGLTRTILYNLNPADNEVFATMAGNFQGSSAKGKIQYGSGWWFLDQKDGIERQINALSNMGLVSRFIGMLTDSRSFLSFPRHEYFRRVVCNIFANDMNAGLIPEDYKLVGGILRGIAHENAKTYFNFESIKTDLTYA